MDGNDKSLLMFSGGRDSTIAAVRLARAQRELVLVTVTSDHLAGIERVAQRLAQLSAHLPAETNWLQVLQPTLPPLGSLGQATCLPCQRAYVAIGTILSLRFGARYLALGYAKYQSSWPEQTPQAAQRLKRLLLPFGLGLQLPVYDLESKAEAERELVQYGLARESLEQKCSRHEGNVEIPRGVLERELDLWVKSIAELVQDAENTPISIIATQRIGEI